MIIMKENKEQNKTFGQKINEFLCKHAQPDYIDEYGCLLLKPNGQPYKSGKVTIWNIIINLIFYNTLIIFLIYIIISLIGWMFSKFYPQILNIDIFWIINYVIYGIILIIVCAILSYTIFFIIRITYKLLSVEVAKCPLEEIPPERKKCECGAPLQFEGEEIKVEINGDETESSLREKCKMCGAPKLEKETDKFTMKILSYPTQNLKGNKL